MSGVLPAQLDRGAQAVVGSARRHLHVHDGHIGPVRERLAQQVLRVAGLRDDLEPRLGQQASDPLAQQHVVLADYDPQGLRHSKSYATRLGRASRSPAEAAGPRSAAGPWGRSRSHHSGERPEGSPRRRRST